MRIYDFLTGFYRLTPAPEDRLALRNLCLAKHITLLSDGEESFRVRAWDGKYLSRVAHENGVSLTLGGIQGLPRIIWKYRRRAGFLVGLALAVLLCTAALGRVWRVDVSGASAEVEQTVRETLSAHGFGVGAKKKDADLSALAATCRLSVPEVGWMSIYYQGTVACVRIKEAALPIPPQTESGKSNLVASRDALIRSVGVAHGTAVIQPGDTVREGDLLISGYTDGTHGGTFFAAEGIVTGAVEEEFTVRIPYWQTVAVPGKTEKCGFGVNFFGKIVNIYGNTGNLPPTYGTIQRERILTLPNGTPLPLSVVITETTEAKEERILLTETEVYALALSRLEGMLSAAGATGNLLQKQTRVEKENNTLVLRCRVVYETDVTRRLPFTVEKTE